VVVNVLCSTIAALALYELTLLVEGEGREGGGGERRRRVRKEEGREKGRAWWTAILFLVNPASIFFVTAYSEVCVRARREGGREGGQWGVKAPELPTSPNSESSPFP